MLHEENSYGKECLDLPTPETQPPKKLAVDSIAGSTTELEKIRQQLSSEVAQKKLLLSVADYSRQDLSILEFFPRFCEDVMYECHWTAYAFDCLPDRHDEASSRSGWHFSSRYHVSEALTKKLETKDIDLFLDSIAVNVIHNGEAICVKNFVDIASSSLLRQLEENGIDQIFAFPILANRHTAGVLYFFSSNKKHSDNSFIGIIETALAHLGQQIEHRNQHAALERNYAQLRDTVSELRGTQSQLIQSEKLVSIGQLSAGIAHEINNPISFIKNNLICLREYMGDIEGVFSKFQCLLDASLKGGSPQLKELAKEAKAFQQEQDIEYIIGDLEGLIEESMQGILRVIKITQGLNNFSRKSSDELCPCHVNHCISEALKIACNELKYKTTLHENYLCDSVVYANEGQLIQVILNIVINAAQSIEVKGDIYITTELDDNRVCIKIRDTGSGIPEDIIESIFNPFFTTKPVGDGTGLGLSISYGIIVNHGGCITVDSEVGAGTQFIIWLPVIDESSKRNLASE